MFTDPISDFLTRIRNAQAAGHATVSSPGSRLKRAMADLLAREGYIEAVQEQTDGPKKTLVLTLKYVNKTPFIRSITRVSTPGHRVYRKSDALPRVLSGQGIALISTSVGIMTNREARKRKLGGEVLCEVT